jgi:hypothetical protein
MRLYTTNSLHLSAPAEKQIDKKFELREVVLKNSLTAAIFQQLIIKL